jgi:hypothetical protein
MFAYPREFYAVHTGPRRSLVELGKARRRPAIELEGFSLAEEAMIAVAVRMLQAAGYDLSLMQVLIRAEMPVGYRGMCWENGAVLGSEAFASPAMLNHVLEEELLHLRQKVRGTEQAFGVGTARTLEEEVDEQRKFTCPDA